MTAITLLMEEHIDVEGTILAVLPGTMFRVQLDNNHEVLAGISGIDGLEVHRLGERASVSDSVRVHAGCATPRFGQRPDPILSGIALFRRPSRRGERC